MEAKVSDEGIQFILWAKRRKKTHDWVRQMLAKYDEAEISNGRISQIVKANRRKRIPDVNPFQEIMIEEGDLDEKGGFIDEDKKVKDIKETLDNNKAVISPTIIQDTMEQDKTLKPENIALDQTAPINLQAILKTSGVKPLKQKQILQMYEMTDGTASELARVLDIAGVSFVTQKQILTQAFGLEYAKKIYEDRKDKTVKKTQPVDQISSAMSQATSILNQKLRSKQAQLAYEEVDRILQRLDSDTKGEGKEDPLKLAKDIAALKVISGDNSTINQKLTDAIVENAIKKNDNTIIDLIKIILDQNSKKGTGSDKDVLLLYQKEIQELRQQTQKQTNDLMQKIIDLQVNNIKQVKDSDEKLNETIRKLEKEKMELLTHQLREKVEQSIRTPEDWLNYMQNMIETGKQMGLVPKQETQDPDQLASIERLRTAENLLESLPEKANNGLNKVLDRMENMMVKYLEFQEKREQRMLNQQQSFARPRMNPRNIRDPRQRIEILNSIENKVDDIEKARQRRAKLRNLY